MEYKYMCISCGDLICELTTTFEMDLPMKCPGNGNPKWISIKAQPDCDYCGVSVYSYCPRCGKKGTT